MPARFDVAEGDPRLCGMLVAVNPQTGKAESAERIEIRGAVAEGGAYDADDGQGRSHD
jgi:calcineurin-like phosphoesterase